MPNPENCDSSNQESTPKNSAAQLGIRLLARREMLVTAESCTGGGVATAVTDIAGSSGWFDRGYVCYQNEAKREALDVPAEILRQHGAVSAECAAAMAQGALKHSRAHIAVSVTGIAGPDGGSVAKPVGTVWFACAKRDDAASVITQCRRFDGDRLAIRRQAVAFALQMLLNFVEAR